MKNIKTFENFEGGSPTTKELKKYNMSRLNGKLIKHLIVDESDGKVTIVTDDESKDFYVDPVDMAVHTGDYIICDLQGEPGIEVSKY